MLTACTVELNTRAPKEPEHSFYAELNDKGIVAGLLNPNLSENSWGFNLAGTEGLEPSTYGTKNRRSTS